MLPVRVIPCLLLKGSGFVKTIRFKDLVYLGDPRNIVRIFNDKEVDEIVVLDIAATPSGVGPQFDLIREIASEAFMPVAYGGGIRSLEDARRILSLGIEKVVLNTVAVENPTFVSEAASALGSQSVVVSIDVKLDRRGRPEVWTRSGSRATGLDPVAFARQAESLGAGEIIVNSIDRDGTMIGYDLDLVRAVTHAVSVPVVACGGAGKLEDLQSAALQGASGVGAGSIFVFHGKFRAVLVNYPSQSQLKSIFSR